MRRALVLCLALAACGSLPDAGTAPGGAVKPAAVTLYRDTVTVAMSDGTLCAGERAGRAGPWRTALAGCPYLWPVTVSRTAPHPRVPLVPARSDPWVTLEPPGGAVLGFAPRPASEG